MRRIAVAKLKPGMELGRPLASGAGETIAETERPLTSDVIDRIRALGITSVYIQDERTADLAPTELLSPKARDQAVRGLKQICRRASERVRDSEWLIPIREVEQITDLLLKEIQRTRDLPGISTIGDRPLADFEFEHAVGCAAAAVRVGMRLERPPRVLHDLCVGALLQNIGKFRLPGLDLSRPEALPDDSREILRKHPHVGYELVRRSRFDPPIAAIVLQHHERLDGSGYPEGRRGPDLYPPAQIVGMCDLYHALISNRPHRGPMVPHLALELLMSHAGFWFSVDLVKAFVNCVPPYDIGTTVRLSSGAVGVVVDPRPGLMGRPTVRLFADESGEPRPDLPEVDLSAVQHLNLVVAEVLDE